jgi:hypothetical protein
VTSRCCTATFKRSVICCSGGATDFGKMTNTTRDAKDFSIRVLDDNCYSNLMDGVHIFTHWK